MRALPTLALCALLVLAGCQLPAGLPGDAPAPGDGGAPDDEAEAGDAAPTTAASTPTTPPPDPETDRLGWEDGYWYNESLPIDESDGLNASERRAMVGRTMARVEHVRRLEFESRVPVEVLNRSAATARLARAGSDERTSDPAFQRFDNAKFEALFLVGERDGSLESQSESINATVGGFYSGSEAAIVVVSPSDTPSMDRGTLAHELVHALQDQHFERAGNVSTRDGYNARNGLHEGDANYVQFAYEDRCEAAWDCVDQPASDSTPTESEPDDGDSVQSNMGVTLLQYFPYSDGPDFVAHLRARGGWAAVDAAYADPPDTAREVIQPSLYPDFAARDVALDVTTRDGWERVRPRGRGDTARLGQSAIASAFAATLYDDYNDSAVVAGRTWLNIEAGGDINETDPLNYDLPGTRGWTGDRLHVYERDGETGYVWRLTWETRGEAAAFAERYRALLAHWGGERVAPDTYVVREDSPYADAFRVTVDGDTVTIVNAPTRDGLAGLDVAPPA